jgi:uncharacterized protein (TIGR00297 family)
VEEIPRWVVGLALGATVAYVAWLARALTTSGAVAAAVAGTVAVGAGWSWAVVLIAYFVTSTLLSRFRAAERTALVAGRIDKEGPRDAAQVLANGGVFVLAAAGYWASPDALWYSLGAAALAASAADTWATELGSLARATPRSILDGRRVAPGTSGGITAQGLAAAISGAAFAAATVWLVRWPTLAVIASLVGGVIGSLLDSLLGAALQVRRWCAACGCDTEQRTHRCGTATTVTGGLRWLDNDGVNALSTLGGALFGAASTRYF